MMRFRSLLFVSWKNVHHLYCICQKIIHCVCEYNEVKLTLRGCLRVKLFLVIFSSLPTGLPRSGKLPVLFLLTGQNQVLMQSILVAPIQVKLCSADGHDGPLSCAKFHLNRHRGGGWECGPKNINKIHFLQKSRPVGATPLTDL